MKDLLRFLVCIYRNQDLDEGLHLGSRPQCIWNYRKRSYELGAELGVDLRHKLSMQCRTPAKVWIDYQYDLSIKSSSTTSGF